MGTFPQSQFTRIGVLQNLDRALKEHDCDPDAVLAQCGLTLERFLDGDNLLPLTEITSLLAYCAEVTANPHFPLYLAGLQDLSFGGNLGLLMQTAASLRDALKELREYIHIHTQAVTLSVHEEGELAFLAVEVDETGLSPIHRQLVVELAIAQFYQMLRALTLSKLQLKAVTLRSVPPTSGQAYRKYFKTPIQFNSEEDSLVILKGNLNMEVSHSNKMLHEVVKNQIKHSGLYRQGQTLPQQVRSAIRDFLPNNRCSIESVAHAIGCDKRTLQRRLQQDFDTHYQALLDEVRFDLACLYLKDTRMPLSQLTYVLGFSDPSNMSRAFRKRFGCSPKQWRLAEQNL